MPNYVYAAFNVTGDRAELKRFAYTMFRPVTDADTGALARTKFIFDYNRIIPLPADADIHLAVDQWGTKWNAFDLDLRVEEDLVWFQFTAAWDFPTPVFEALAAEFPRLVFAGSAYEENHDFELTGEFNGNDDWGPGKIEWVIGGPGDCDDD